MWMDDEHEGSDEELEAGPESGALERLLAASVVRTEFPERWLRDETAAMLAVVCPPVDPSRGLAARLRRLEESATADLAFEAAARSRRRPETLGQYLAFLREQAGLSAAETAKKLRFDFQLLGELERDQVRPQRIPGARLAELVRRLKGTLEMTERLLITTVRAPRMVAGPASGGGPLRLYRGARGGSRARSEAASRAARGEETPLIENPEYSEEIEAVRSLTAEVRHAWAARR